ncbi:hypothetical protein ACFQX6_37545 [Streptosporangium lutulentum]
MDIVLRIKGSLDAGLPTPVRGAAVAGGSGAVAQGSAAVGVRSDDYQGLRPG